MAANESTIRDSLSTRLEILEEGLSLLDVESYIPNPQGTRGFIDILARDSRGKFVLIELKRSNAASRDAAHEVLKYVEGVKAVLAVREDELRVFIVSTEWGELLVPFSSLNAKVTFPLEGFALETTEQGMPVSARSVMPLKLAEGRLFVPWHEVNLYLDAKRAEDGIASYRRSCEEKGIEDFVLIQMRSSDKHHKNEIDSTYAYLSMLAEKFNSKPRSYEEVAASIPEHNYMLYFAMVQLDKDFCLAKIRLLAEADDLEEFIEVLDSDLEESLGQLHNKLMEVGLRPVKDYFEIGYPAKFIKVLDDEDWRVEKVHRFGALAKNSLLTDETILRELRGEQGVTKQSFKKTLQQVDSRTLRSVRNEVSNCLEDNPQWLAQINKVFDGIGKMGGIDEIEISIFNPSNILLSIYLFLAKSDGMLYVPSYRVSVKKGAEMRTYLGVLVCTGSKPSLSNIVKNNYENSYERALFSLNWGGYEEGNARVTRDAALAYATFLVEHGDNDSFFRMTDVGFELCEREELSDFFQSYFSENETFIRDVCELFSQHWDGVMVNWSEAASFRPKT